MEQYISKDALVREIEKQRNTYISEPSKYRVLSRILSLIDALEVKEVDLEKEIKRFTMSKELYEADSVIKAVAEHFFELGLKTQKGE